MQNYSHFLIIPSKFWNNSSALHHSQNITYFEEIVFAKSRVNLNMTRTCHEKPYVFFLRPGEPVYIMVKQ
jgi:hypothetical protein